MVSAIEILENFDLTFSQSIFWVEVRVKEKVHALGVLWQLLRLPGELGHGLRHDVDYQCEDLGS